MRSMAFNQHAIFDDDVGAKLALFPQTEVSNDEGAIFSKNRELQIRRLAVGRQERAFELPAEIARGIGTKSGLTSGC